jgi:hypothetical protein
MIARIVGQRRNYCHDAATRPPRRAGRDFPKALDRRRYRGGAGSDDGTGGGVVSDERVVNEALNS